MRTISDASAHRWAPKGLSGVTVARSSAFSVRGSWEMSSSRSLISVAPSFFW
jgi:hypothetical protein